MTSRVCVSCGHTLRAQAGRWVHNTPRGHLLDNNHRAVLGTYTPPTLTVGSLFSGIGGIDLGLERAGMRVVWQCEVSEFCRAVLAKHWPDVPCYPDMTTVDWSTVEPVDVLCGGFPCQDISAAGLKTGITGRRSSLWGEFARAIRELRPRYVLVENVGDLAVRGLDVVLGDLCELGFDAEWSALSACAVGAPHPRRRLFIVAHTTGSNVADQVPHDALSHRGHPDWKGQPRGSSGDSGGGRRWLPEPAVGRVAVGLPWRVVRPQLSALGNSAVPQVVEWIGRRIVEDHGEPVALPAPPPAVRAPRKPQRPIAPLPQPVNWGPPVPWERKPFDQELTRRRGCETAAGLDVIGEL